MQISLYADDGVFFFQIPKSKDRKAARRFPFLET